MVARARLRIAGLYIALLTLIVLLVAGSLVLRAASEARRTADLELRLRAEGVAAELQRAGATPSSPARRDDDDDHEQDAHDDERGRGLERAGLLAFTLPVRDGAPVSDQPARLGGLPDLPAARQALAAGVGQYSTLTLPEGAVRLYSVPVQAGGQVVAVVQVARSRAFVESTVRGLLVSLLVSGLAGLAVAAPAGYWLAGRTLQPIAQAMQRQRDFVADASHELRTPLAVIQGNIDHMRRFADRPVAEYDDVMEDIAAETERLSRMVAGLLTLARIDDGRLHLDLGEVNLSRVAQELAADLEPLAWQKGLDLRASVQPDVIVRGDADRLRQLGMALLENAVRYTDSGQIALDLSATGTTVTLRVADTGPGIAAEHLPRVFDRFYRTPAARTSAVAGTGLGLAIARWIADAHGGSLSASSVPGEGSAFTFTMPRQVRPRAHPTAV